MLSVSQSVCLFVRRVWIDSWLSSMISYVVGCIPPLLAYSSILRNECFMLIACCEVATVSTAVCCLITLLSIKCTLQTSGYITHLFFFFLCTRALSLSHVETFLLGEALCRSRRKKSDALGDPHCLPSEYQVTVCKDLHS